MDVYYYDEMSWVYQIYNISELINLITESKEFCEIIMLCGTKVYVNKRNILNYTRGALLIVENTYGSQKDTHTKSEAECYQKPFMIIK